MALHIESIQKSENTPKARVTVVGVDKQGDGGTIPQPPAKEFENPFLRDLTDGRHEAPILLPPIDHEVFQHLVNENNALNQLITAYEVNIDGTGFDIEKEDGTEAESEADKQTILDIKDFYNEAWPGVSFMTIRRELRRDQEITGNAYLEVLRTLEGKIAFAKRVDPKTMRLVRLDPPILVQKTVKRMGEELTFNMFLRERRYAQVIPPFQTALEDTEPTTKDISDAEKHRVIYFRDFSSSRQVDKITGRWETEDNPIPVPRRGTEIIHFSVYRDVRSPYGLPRWIGQIPSIVGSRKAEELNVQFFSSGGIPPILVMVQGGELTEEVRNDLTRYLANNNTDKTKAAIVEVHSTGGDLESTNNVKVTVERFGSERQKDSLYEKYDTNSEQRVRSSFRLGPLFVGRTQDFNFATAFASYIVAEAQTFAPERAEFDEKMNNTLMKEMAPGWKYKSKPLILTDITNQLKGLELGKDVAGAESFVENVNEVTGLTLKSPDGVEDVAQPDDDAVDEGTAATGAAGSPSGAPQPPRPTSGAPGPVQKMDSMSLVELANRWASVYTGAMSGANGSLPEASLVELKVMRNEVETLDGTQHQLFERYVAMRLMSGMDHDYDGSADLCGVATELLARVSTDDLDASADSDSQ